MKVRIGTSGWHYNHWRGPFYPAGLPKAEFLRHYVLSFDTVELNNTFYRLPEEQALRKWVDDTPEAFLFAVKASRYITHRKRLLDAGEALSVFLETVRVLGAKLGPILFQLPPHWGFNEKRLADFLAVLPNGFRYVFEFRSAAWFNQSAYDIMAKRGVGFCIHDFKGAPSPKEVTSDLIYVRFHGPNNPYQGWYDDDFLAWWSKQIKKWASEKRTIVCYFNNDEAGYAVRNALRLKEMIHG